MTTTLTQQFADEYAKKAVPGMLRTIRLNKLANKGILLGAVAASYLHQAHFLNHLGAGVFSWILPGVFDLGIVSMLTITQAVGMAAEAKRAALAVLVVVVLISGTVNFLAPGQLILRIIFAVVVALVAGVEWVAGKVRPDFNAIEHAETTLAATGTHTPTPAQQPAPVPAPAPAPATPPASTSRAGSTPVTEPAHVPAHLLTPARFSSVQHEQSTGRAITVDELAVRMSITPAVAAQLLAEIRDTTPSPTGVNGHVPALDGGAR